MRVKKKYMSDFVKIDQMQDEEIDYTDSPPTDEKFWESATVVFPKNKVRLSARVDADVMNWFKAQGKGYQTKINAALRTYMQAHQKSSQS